MKLYILKRILFIIPLVLVVAATNFLIIHSAPGDPVYYLAGEAATPAYIDMMRNKLGLDKPLYEQFLLYILSLFRGDLGYSFIYQQPVLTLILSRLPATLLLMITGYAISFTLGIILGAILAKKRNSRLDKVFTVISLTGYAMPTFWLAMMSIVAFSLHLKLLPAQGMFSSGAGSNSLHYVADVLFHLVLPTLVIATYYLALIFRLTRANMIDALTQDYIVTARSKGLPERTIVFRHALRNALLPVITVITMQFGKMFEGALMTEIVFAWPGIGRLAYDALIMRDYPLILGLFVLSALLIAIFNIIGDILYSFLDPRIRYGSSR